MARIATAPVRRRMDFAPLAANARGLLTDQARPPLAGALFLVAATSTTAAETPVTYDSSASERFAVSGWPTHLPFDPRR